MGPDHDGGLAEEANLLGEGQAFGMNDFEAEWPQRTDDVCLVRDPPRPVDGQLVPAELEPTAACFGEHLTQLVAQPRADPVGMGTVWAVAGYRSRLCPDQPLRANVGVR